MKLLQLIAGKIKEFSGAVDKAKMLDDDIGNTVTALQAKGHIDSTANPHGVTASQAGAEPAFSKNTGFNKNFGTIAGTVAEGNHNHDGVYEPVLGFTPENIANKGTASGYCDLDASGLVPVSRIPSSYKEIFVVADITARDALTPFEGMRVHVIDASADSTVDSGWAEYLYGSSSWTKTAENESIDVVLQWANVNGKPTTISGYGITDAYTKTEADANYLGKTAKAADSEKLDNHDSAEFPLLAALNTFTATQTIKNGVAGASKNYILLQPTDYGTGKPGLMIKSGTSADEFKIALWDGSTNDGTINLSASNVKAPSFVENEVALSDKYLGKTAQAADSAKLGGATASDAASNSTIVKRTANGYIYANYFHTSASIESGTATHYFIEKNSDNFIRKKSLADVKTEIVTSAAVAAGLGFTPEPAFTKKTAFNKDFGTVAGTVVEGNDPRLSSGGTMATYIHLVKTSGANQNIGGANGTEVVISWDSETKKDTGFTHSTVTNNSRIYVDTSGTYNLRAVVTGVTTGSARTSIGLAYRINGGSTILLGGTEDYSRGSAYGAKISPSLNTKVVLNANDYIEIVTYVDDTDAVYTINTLETMCEVILETDTVPYSTGITSVDGRTGVVDLTDRYVRKDGDTTLNAGVQITADDHKVTTAKTTAVTADMCLTNVVFQTSTTLPTASNFTKGTIILVHEA